MPNVLPPLCVIVNPLHLRGRGLRRWRKYVELLADRAAIRVSDRPGMSEVLARRAAEEGFGTVVAAGGDGTIHQVANGLIASGRTDVALGVLPLGSGNDYAASLRLPREPKDLVATLFDPQCWSVDLGAITDDRGRHKVFINTLGIGLNGAVVWEKQLLPWLSGLVLYGAAALQSIRRHFHCLATTLVIDGQERDWPTIFLAVALGRSEGGGFLVAPRAELDDGWFDYLHAARLGRLAALRYLPRLLRGDIPTDDPAIHQGRCRRLQVTAQSLLPIHLDGETFTLATDDVRSVQVEILPGALRLRCRKV